MIGDIYEKIYSFNVIDIVAKNNGYKDKLEMLSDYGFVPTVIMPKHRKSEFISLLLKCSFAKKENKNEI